MHNHDLHIIEPTLRDQTGHCYALVMDLLNIHSSESRQYHIWLSKQGEELFRSQNDITEHHIFSRRLRRIQAFFLYRKLIREEKRFFISTATTTDLQLLDWAFRSQRKSATLNTKQIKLYMHWLYPSKRKVQRLEKIAQRYPDLNLACPTKSVQDILKKVGFVNVELISYPSATNQTDNDTLQTEEFHKVLFAGAARVDKGFPTVVEIIDLLKEANSNIPVTIQCSTTHKGVHGEEISSAIDRLQEINYPFLTSLNETLDRDDYQAMMKHSILIQPYDTKHFADRVSGVTLDALKAGSPVVVPANTWMARLVERFDAGVIVEKHDDAHQWLQAIQSLISRWEHYAHNASLASDIILSEHSPEIMVNWLYDKAS